MDRARAEQSRHVERNLANCAVPRLHTVACIHLAQNEAALCVLLGVVRSGIKELDARVGTGVLGPMRGYFLFSLAPRACGFY